MILLRDGPDGVEVFLQRRINRMTFAPGCVFPGGRVEQSDAVVAWSGPSDEPFPLSGSRCHCVIPRADHRRRA